MEIRETTLFSDYPLCLKLYEGIPTNLAEISVSYSTKVAKEKRIRISSSEDCYKVFLQTWNKASIEYYEEFKVLYLNRQNEVLGLQALSKGGVAGTVVDMKIIFGTALKTVASSLILAHNHPSCELRPSSADKDLTRKMAAGAKLLDLQVLDHIIVTPNAYYSFADEGLL